MITVCRFHGSLELQSKNRACIQYDRVLFFYAVQINFSTTTINIDHDHLRHYRRKQHRRDMGADDITASPKSGRGGSMLPLLDLGGVVMSLATAVTVINVNGGCGKIDWNNMKKVKKYF